MSIIVFGFIGTFGQWHGIDVLEKIIPVLVAVRKDVHFLLIGDGPAKASLEASFYEQGIADQVTFTGKILPQDAPRHLAQCDVFLCPNQPNKDGSRFFGSPTKLFEYLSMGKPVIASDLEQLAEIVQPAIRMHEQSPVITDQVGIVVAPSDVQGFIDACLYVASLSEVDRNQMGINARKKALDQYTWRSHVQKIMRHAQL